MQYKGVIVLDGADGAGKTTLGRHLEEKHGAFYIHLTKPEPGCAFALMTDALLQADARRNDQLVVIDRHWMSENIYGRVYRKESELPIASRMLYRCLLRMDAVHVICAPPVNYVVETHARLKEKREEMYDDVREVAVRYHDLWHGSVVRPKDGDLCEQLSAFGGVQGNHKFVLYDVTQHGRRMAQFAKRIAELANEHKNPGLWELTKETKNLQGHISFRSTLLVGQQLSDKRPAGASWPFFSAGDSSLWLNRALHVAAIPEERLVLMNAYDDDAYLLKEVSKHCGKVVALGSDAEQRLGDYDIPCARVPHPQYSRRFQQSGLVGYAKLLEEAIYGL